MLQTTRNYQLYECILYEKYRHLESALNIKNIDLLLTICQSTELQQSFSPWLVNDRIGTVVKKVNNLYSQ